MSRGVSRRGLSSAHIGASARAVLIAGLGAFAGCGDSGRAPSFAVDTLATGRIVVRNDPGVLHPSATRWVLREELHLGRTEGTGPDVFGTVSGLAVDNRGTMFVADGFAKEVRVFAPDGTFLRRFGREGEGPGEFRMISGLVWTPPGALWVMDPVSGRLTRFDTLGNVISEHRRGDFMFATVPWAARPDTMGRLYDIEPVGEPGENRRRAVARLSADDTELRTLGHFVLPDGPPQTMIVSRRGGITARTPVPMSAALRWAVDPGGDLWLASTDRYRLHRVRIPAGDTLRTVIFERPPEPLKGAERDSIARAEGIDSGDLPRNKPVFGWIVIADDGRLWVGREPEGPVTSWDLFDAGGRYLGAARSPVSVHIRRTPPIARGNALWAVTVDAMGVQGVVRLRLVKQ